MQYRTRFIVSAALVAVVLGVSLRLIDNDTPSAEAPNAERQPAHESPPATMHTPSSEVLANNHSTAQPATPTSKSKRREFDELAMSKDATDRFRAYMLAQACVWAHEAQRNAEMTVSAQLDATTRDQLQRGEFKAKTEAACGDLSDQQLAERRKYLEDAAEAGVAMAALRLSAEGPFGDPSALSTRPDDPAVLEWRRHIVGLLELAAQKGDVNAMASLSNMYASGTGVVESRNPMKALQYQTALWEAWTKSTGKTSPFAEQRIKELSQGLSADQVEAAKKAGHLLAMGEGK